MRRYANISDATQHQYRHVPLRKLSQYILRYIDVIRNDNILYVNMMKTNIYILLLVMFYPAKETIYSYCSVLLAFSC